MDFNKCPFWGMPQMPMNQTAKQTSKRLDDHAKRIKKHFTTEEALAIGTLLGIDFSKFDVEQYRMGLDVELEHGLINPLTNVTNDDPLLTGKIALAHLNEFPDYYTRLKKLEERAEKFWGKEEEE